MKSIVSKCVVVVLGLLVAGVAQLQAADAPKAASSEVSFCIKKVSEGAKLADFTKSVHEFQGAQKVKPSAAAAIQGVFAKIDINKDGVLSKGELATGAAVNGAAGCGTCDTQGLGCSSGCHCHSSDQSCGKDGDGSGR
jgi:hypothetical protein